MGSAGTYTCMNCGHTAEWVTADFDCGMMGDVVTPVVCREHGLRSADTGLSARLDPDWAERREREYPCPECGGPSPLWDRRTCPACGHRGAENDGWFPGIDWD
jgi:rubrerythrin